MKYLRWREMPREVIGAAIAGFSVACVIGWFQSGVALERPRPLGSASEVASGWQEIAWPFPRDGWPSGHAYRCLEKSCGGDIQIFVRPKIGFCNCTTGVADDDEVDRVADIDLISERFHPLHPGQTVTLVNMPGRTRSYAFDLAVDSKKYAVGMAVSHGCDLLVAAVLGNEDPADMQRRAVAFLSSSTPAQWITTAMQDGS